MQLTEAFVQQQLVRGSLTSLSQVCCRRPNESTRLMSVTNAGFSSFKDTRRTGGEPEENQRSPPSSLMAAAFPLSFPPRLCLETRAACGVRRAACGGGGTGTSLNTHLMHYPLNKVPQWTRLRQVIDVSLSRSISFLCVICHITTRRRQLLLLHRNHYILDQFMSLLRL